MSLKKRFYFVSIFMLHAFIVKSQNLLNTTPWTVGSGSAPGFVKIGNDAENIRELGLDHIGNSTILWKAVPDNASNADGGWDSDYIEINHNKSYRFSVWIKKTNSNDGTTYFGCQSYFNSSYHILGFNGVTANNPYFWYGDLPKLNRWYLLVGYIHKSSYTDNVHIGKIYDGTTGEIVLSISDFKFAPSATKVLHRAYLYYDINTNDRQYFSKPRIEVVGEEISILELLEINPDSKLLFAYDNAGNQKQRFYCEYLGCTVPNPPAGRMGTPNSEVIEETEITNIEDTINLYPNPTKDFVNIKLKPDTSQEITSVKVYNVNASLIQDLKISNKDNLIINLSDKPSGVYFVHIHFKGSTNGITKKIIKE